MVVAASRVPLVIAALLLAATPSRPAEAAPPTDAPTTRLDDGERDKPEAAGKCVKAKPEARYSGYGYDHLVHLDNTCKEDMRCTVTTNTNARGVKIDVPKGEQRVVVTFRGSPAREFTYDVECAPK
jgi:hypothetical protein